MMNRRELLTSIASSPLLLCPAKLYVPQIKFIEERHLIAKESAAGYQSLSSIRDRCKTSSIINRSREAIMIAPGMRDASNETYSRLLKIIYSGAWLLLEGGVCFSSDADTMRHLRVLNDVFKLGILPSVRTAEMNLESSHSYVSYSWPIKRLVRSFHAASPLNCQDQNVIARFGGMPVCAKKSIGKGGVIYLGSMLGPGLFADEREAHVLGNAIISEILQ